MKYFELTLDRDTYKTAPKLINWYRVQDVRLIKWESYHKLQKRQIYNIEPSSETIFTDIVSFPFLLVSTMVKDVIEMYGDEVIFREIILMDSQNEIEQVYYLPVMRENLKTELSYMMNNDNMDYHKNSPQWIAKKNIFWVSQKGERHTIISLDLAESLLHRGAIGLQLKEVRLITKDNV